MTVAPTGITDPLVASRYAQAVDLNPASFTTCTGTGTGWYPIRTDRPVVVWPVRSLIAPTVVTGASVAAGGTGYTVGNTLTVTGGTGTAATFTVSQVASGAVRSVTLATAGSYTVLPTNPVATTGAGTGAQLTLSFGQGSQTTYNSGSVRVIYYAPNRIPISVDDAQRSKGSGVVYLPNPGTWYLRAATDTDGEWATVQYLVIDAQDPAIAARYLSESGTHRIKTNAYVGSIASTSVQLVAENRNRTGLLITATTGQTASPALAKLRLGFGTTAVNNSGTEIGTSTTATFAMFGDACWKGSVSAIFSDSNSGGTTGQVTVTEWE
jgi:hypothetical protein